MNFHQINMKDLKINKTEKGEIIMEKRHVIVFYIDVGNVSAPDVPSYLDNIKKNIGLDKEQRELLRVVSEFYIPVRDESSHVDVLDFD